MNLPIEIHFQEGFRGQDVRIRLDQDVVKELTPRTRFQLGLAQVETVSAGPGQVLRIEIPEPGLAAEHIVRANDTCIVVNHLENVLTIRSVPVAPGYV